MINSAIKKSGVKMDNTKSYLISMKNFPNKVKNQIHCLNNLSKTHLTPKPLKPTTPQTKVKILAKRTLKVIKVNKMSKIPIALEFSMNVTSKRDISILEGLITDLKVHKKYKKMKE